MTVLETLLERMVNSKGDKYFELREALRSHLREIDDIRFQTEVRQMTDTRYLWQLLGCGLMLNRQNMVTTRLQELR